MIPCKLCSKKDLCDSCIYKILSRRIKEDIIYAKILKKKKLKKLPVGKTKTGYKGTTVHAEPCISCHQIKQSVYHLDKGVICSQCRKIRDSGAYVYVKKYD